MRLTRNQKIILIVLAVVCIIALRLALTIEASEGRRHDDVPGKECEHGVHQNNPHCFTPSPEPTPTPDCSITPSVTPTIAISPTNSLTPTETIYPTETATPIPTASITEAPMYHEEVVEDRVIYVWPGEQVEQRGVSK